MTHEVTGIGNGNAQYFEAGASLPDALKKQCSEAMDSATTAVLWITKPTEEEIVWNAKDGDALLTIVAPRVKATMLEYANGTSHHRIVVGEEAEYCLASRGGQAQLTHLIDVAGGAHGTMTVALLGNGMHTLTATLRGAHAISDVNVLMKTHEKERCRSRMENVFLDRSGGGQIFVRALGETHSHLDVAGKITIGPKGGGTDTYLTQEVLLLDPTATVHAIPGLEITTNDVKASHSASVSRLTPEDLFYLASRGLSEQDARQLFLRGFLGAVAERTGDGRLTAKVMEWILETT